MKLEIKDNQKESKSRNFYEKVFSKKGKSSLKKKSKIVEKKKIIKK